MVAGRPFSARILVKFPKIRVLPQEYFSLLNSKMSVPSFSHGHVGRPGCMIEVAGVCHTSHSSSPSEY